MNPLIQLKTTPLLLITLALLCLGFLSRVQAVVPPPDGGYPNFNTAEGQNALMNLTTGAGNTAVGFSSLFTGTTASLNTGVGAGTLFFNTGDQNTATGAGALLNNTTGNNNTASGVLALFDNTTGGSNTATGFGALGNNTIGNENTANGANALLSNTTGNGNTASGSDALTANTTGNANTAIGGAALSSNTTGNSNTAIGAAVLANNTTGNENTATGLNALATNTEGGGNTANGRTALANNTTGNNNTAIGLQALLLNSTGSNNTAVGLNALEFNTIGGGNTALGQGAGVNVSTANNVICIGANGENVDNTCYIGQIFGQTSSGGTAVFINSNGRLGTATSSRRFKEEIRPMERASEALFALKPVTFRYKKGIDPAGIPQFGLIAEDVEAANPDLVVCDREGKPYSVRYEQVNAMLLNEFLREHRKVEQMQKQIDALAAGLQRVSAQLAAASPSDGGLDLNKRAPQIAVTNR